MCIDIVRFFVKSCGGKFVVKGVLSTWYFGKKLSNILRISKEYFEGNRGYSGIRGFAYLFLVLTAAEIRVYFWNIVISRN